MPTRQPGSRPRASAVLRPHAPRVPLAGRRRLRRRGPHRAARRRRLLRQPAVAATLAAAPAAAGPSLAPLAPKPSISRPRPSAASSSSSTAGRRRWTCSTTSRSCRRTTARPSTSKSAAGSVQKQKLLASRRSFKQYGQSGPVVLATLLPHMSRHMDKLAVIKILYADSFAHGSAMIQMNSGRIIQGHPSLGSWLGYGLGTLNQNLPGYVVMLDPRGGPISGAANWSSGYMPAAYQGTVFRSVGQPILNLEPGGGADAANAARPDRHDQRAQRRAPRQPPRLLRTAGPHRQLRAGLPAPEHRPRSARPRRRGRARPRRCTA